MEADLPPATLPSARIAPVARIRALLPLLAVAGVVLLADQLSKLWVVEAIGRAAATHRIDVLPGLLLLQYVENTGAAFGMFHNDGWPLAIVAIAVVAGILITAPRMQQDAYGGLARWQVLLSLGLVLGGAVGNLVDRIFRGFVVDFVLVQAAQVTLGKTLYQFPNFNVADSAITVGIILLVAHLFFGGERKHTA